MRAVPIFLLAGCTSLSGCLLSNAKSGLKHTQNEPTRQQNPNPLDWAASTDPQSDYNRLVAPNLKRGAVPAEFLSDTHPLTIRFQYWLNAIDQTLRTKNPKRFDSIPKPLARIWKSGSPNGFASPIQQCVATRVQFKESNEEDSVPLPLMGVSFSGVVFASQDTSCVKNSTATLFDVVEWFSRNIDSCSLSLSNQSLVIGQECKRAPSLQTTKTGLANGFSVNSTSPIITLTSSLFALLETEQQLIGVIAHELGHYYRSHPAMLTSKYNFFYRLESTNPEVRPTPDRTLEELGKRAIIATRKPQLNEEAKEILREAERERLGYYTFEQEADEFAAETLAVLGFSPVHLIEKMFHFLRYKKVSDSEFEYGYESCKKRHDSNWRDGENRPIYIPIGTFANPHHSLCYRIFNLSREIKTHKYKVQENLEPAMPQSPTWADLKKLAWTISPPSKLEEELPSGVVP